MHFLQTISSDELKVKSLLPQNKQNSSEKPENVIDKCRQVWDFLHKMCDAQLSELSFSQPYASEMDLMSTAVPFLVEHKLSGELLGLSDILSVDCFDYLRTIMFDLKVTSIKEDWHRLYSLGYALVFESIHEVPVDICCTVYLSVENGKISVQKRSVLCQRRVEAIVAGRKR